MTEDDLDDFEPTKPTRPEFENTTRPRGILTQTDRQVLAGMKRYDSKQGMRNARHRIREHIRQSLNDVYVVNRTLDASELKQIEERQRELDVEQERRQVVFAPAATELGVRLSYALALDDPDNSVVDEVERNVTEALFRVVGDFNDDIVVTDVNVDIDLERESAESDELLNEIVFGKPSPHKVTQYMANGNADRLRRRLLELDAEIEVEGGNSIGPDDKLFSMFGSETDD
jgi:hypothetical protein